MQLWHATLAWQLQAIIREDRQSRLEKLVLSSPNCLMTFCVPLLLMRMGRVLCFWTIYFAYYTQTIIGTASFFHLDPFIRC